MFTKTAKKFWVFISSAVASVCLAVGAIAMPSANVTQAAIDGSLSEEVTLKKIEATNGVTAEGTKNDYISFDMGTNGGNVWIMTQFTGKNAPNYAFNANKPGLETWTAADASTSAANLYEPGVLITNTSESYNYCMQAFLSTDTSNNGKLVANFPNDNGTLQVGSENDDVGMKYFVDGTEYIQIIGYEKNAQVDSALDFTLYMFKISDGKAQLVYKYTPKSDGTANGSDNGFNPYYSNVVLYGNIHCDELDSNPDSVTFQYAKPATSLEEMLKGVSDYYEYKDDIVSALEIIEDVSQKVEVSKTEKTSLTSNVTLKKIEATNGVTAEGTKNDYVSFDMGTNGGNVWIMTQFTGKNAPNYAFNANKPGLETWTAADASTSAANLYEPGVLITNTSESYNYYMQAFRSTDTSNGKAVANFPNSNGTLQVGSERDDAGMKYFVDGTEYIQIIGYEKNAQVDSALDFTLYMFKISDGKAQLVYKYTPKSDGTANGSDNGFNPYYSNVVLYGNIHCDGLDSNPDSVTFSYEEPKTNLTDLIKGLDNAYAYKDDLAEALGVSLDSMGAFTVAYEDMNGNILKTFAEVEAVKLPGSTLADFAGWYNKADGKLYKAGETIALTANTTFVEVATGVDLADGAAVRLVKDAAGVGGLRFEASFSKAAYDLLGANMKVEGGVIPTDLLNGEFALNNEDARYVELTNTVLKGGEYLAYITLTNIKLENFQRAFSARVFVTVTYADGTTATIMSEYDEEYHSRSIYQVAVKAYNSGNYGENEMLKYYIDNSASVALTVNEGVVSVTTAHTFDGLKESYVRGYTVSGVSYTEGTVSFTVTLKDTTVNGNGVVTMWTAEKVSQEVVVTFVNGVASVNFPVAL